MSGNTPLSRANKVGTTGHVQTFLPYVVGRSPKIRPELDAAEAWLQEHDPDYEHSRESWRHVRGEDYTAPRQEVSVGDARDIERIVYGEQRGQWLAAQYAGERYCNECGRTYTPRQYNQRYCSQKHYWRAKKREQRARKSEQATTAWDLGVTDGPFAA